MEWHSLMKTSMVLGAEKYTKEKYIHCKKISVARITMFSLGELVVG